VETFKVAVASCCSIENRPDQPAWRDIAAARPDLLLLLGDNVYMHKDDVDEDVWQFARLEANYAAQFQQPDFLALLNLRIPTMVTWDDHDFGINDAKGADAPAEYVRRTTALFNQWWQFRLRDDEHPERIYCRRTFGSIRVIMLDGRTERPRASKTADPLGETQTRWLLDELAQPWQGITLVACGSTLNIGGRKSERLAGYEDFAGRLVNALRKCPRALYLGGDLHYNAVNDRHGFIEIMTSGVAQVQWSTKLDTDNWALLEFGSQGNTVTLHGAPAKHKGQDRHRFRITPDWKLAP
jgi:alkaline phosphatase D